MDWVNSRAIQHYSNGTMNIYEFIILLGLSWVTHTDTIYTWFLRSLVRFFFLRFSLFTSDEMQLSNCSTWHLVCCPCAETCTRTEILEPVSCVFFAVGPAPLSDLSVSCSLWARPHQRPHLLPLLQSQPAGCYFMLFYTKTMQETNEVTDILCRYVCKYNNIYQSVCACKNRMRKSWNPGKSIKWTRPTNVGFHLQTWDQHGVVDDHCVYSKRFQSLVCFHFLEYASGDTVAH